MTSPAEHVPGRWAKVVLVHGGELLGVLPPVPLQMPWWPEVQELVAAVRSRHGLQITVLRLLQADAERTAGGSVSYLAETDRAPSLTLDAWPGEPSSEHPLQQVWARPGGPGKILDWADEQLAQQALTRTGPAVQMRTWNLSAMWQIPTDTGRIWLKAVPSFFAHEGAVIDWIGQPVAPRLIAFAPGRALIADVPGPPNHELRAAAALSSMVRLLFGVQQRALGQLGELAALGVPDRRLETMVPRINTVVEQWGSALDLPERRSLDTLLSSLSPRLTAIAECGVPDTLVHGDFHPGNAAGRPERYVILDWGDSFIGHPLIDERAFTERLAPSSRRAARSWFVSAWQRIAPDSDPARAATLLEPVTSLLAAVMYADFCRDIEPDERVYHRSDVLRVLRDAAAQDASW